MKRRLFKMAWAIKAQFGSLSEALKFAWKVIKLQFRLVTEALVSFKYKKIDGTIRQANGSNANLPYTGNVRKEPQFGLLTYWDLDALAFRSAKIENLLF